MPAWLNSLKSVSVPLMSNITIKPIYEAVELLDENKAKIVKSKLEALFMKRIQSSIETKGGKVDSEHTLKFAEKEYKLTSYEGEMRGGIPHGRGEGHYQEERKEGEETFQPLCCSGNRRSVYIGQYKDGFPEGRGTFNEFPSKKALHMSFGDSRYKLRWYNGEWIAGLPHGSGEGHYTIESDVIGRGFGSLISRGGQNWYQGDWKRGEPVSYTHLTLPTKA